MTETDARVAFCVRTSRELGDHLYIWGGDSEGEGGMDCSGFASTRMMWADKLWPGIYTGGRTTAAGLYRHYDGKGVPDIKRVDHLVPGALVFYRRYPSSKIYHVAIHICTVDGKHLDAGPFVEVGPMAIESGGSGSGSTTPRAALIASAGVRFTASDYHGRGLWVAKDPFSLLTF